MRCRVYERRARTSSHSGRTDRKNNMVEANLVYTNIVLRRRRAIHQLDVFVLVLDLRWLEHAGNAHRGLPLCIGLLARGSLLLLEV